MSHFTSLQKAQIKDVEAFIAACQELGFTNIRRNVSITDYNGKTITVDVAAGNGGRYDVALQKNANGSYSMVSDWWGIRTSGSRLSSHFKGCAYDEDIQNVFLKHTTKNTLINNYKRQGFRATYTESENGDLHLQLSRNSY